MKKFSLAILLMALLVCPLMQAQEVIYVDTEAEFPGGVQAMMSFIGSNLVYPEEARRNNIEGRVLVEFVVEKDGSISNVSVISDIGAGCGEEVIRVIQQMPKWKPAKYKRKRVRSRFTLPVIFRLNETTDVPDVPEQSWMEESDWGDLRELVQEMNKECPVEYPLYLIYSVELVEDTIVFNCTLRTDVYDTTYFRRMFSSGEIKRTTIRNMLASFDQEDYEGMVGSGISLKFNYSFFNRGRDEVVYVTPQDLRTHYSPDLLYADSTIIPYLTNAARLENSICPYSYDETTTLMKVWNDGTHMKYLIEFDDSELSVQSIQESAAEIKASLTESLLDVLDEDLRSWYHDNGVSFTYIYRGMVSSQQIEITISPADYGKTRDQ